MVGQSVSCPGVATTVCIATFDTLLYDCRIDLYLINHLPLHSLGILLHPVKGSQRAGQPALHLLSLCLQC